MAHLLSWVVLLLTRIIRDNYAGPVLSLGRDERCVKNRCRRCGEFCLNLTKPRARHTLISNGY